MILPPSPHHPLTPFIEEDSPVLFNCRISLMGGCSCMAFTTCKRLFAKASGDVVAKVPGTPVATHAAVEDGSCNNTNTTNVAKSWLN
jgi:hypothetical protein